MGLGVFDIQRLLVGELRLGPQLFATLCLPRRGAATVLKAAFVRDFLELLFLLVVLVTVRGAPSSYKTSSMTGSTSYLAVVVLECTRVSITFSINKIMRPSILIPKPLSPKPVNRQRHATGKNAKP